MIHTAGRTPPAPDEELYRANFWATIHLLSALRSITKPARVVLSGSAAELGPVDPDDLPVDETYTGYPRDAYGRSKYLATSAGLAERSPLEVMVARVFNPIGPGTPPTQAFGRFADRLTDPDADPLDLVVGDLDARRDFIDVRDVARAMIALALQRPGRTGLQRGHRPIAPCRRRARPADRTERPNRASQCRPGIKEPAAGRPIRGPISTASSTRPAGSRRSRGSRASTISGTRPIARKRPPRIDQVAAA